ncbi:MAG TPA: hypothetical protein VM869_13025 [Enhygromyxa sp.]|nr:hypothetical protein [Enhygromyxa sp.]
MSGRGHVRRPATRSSPELAQRLRAPASHGADPRRVGFATMTMLLCLAALVALTLARARIAKHVRSPLSYKLADADRVAYYVVERDAGPSFRIGPGDRTLKLITHLLLPATTLYDPEQEFAYGLVVILRSLDGEEQWRHELNIRTRQSKSGGDRFGWRYENAFMLGDDRQLSDDRLTRVRLPAGQQDRLLELRLIPNTPATEVSGLARVYVRRPRPADDQALRELSLAPEAARELVDHLTWRDWDQLSEDERRVKLSHIWQRLAAEGEPGRDYHTLSIYETGFRLPRGTETDERRLEVDRWRSLAINVIGPAELELRVLGNTGEAGALDIHRLGLDGVRESYPRHGASVRPLTIPDGIHTLFIESERRVELALEVEDAAAERVWLIEAERPIRESEHGNEVLEPDRRRIEIVRVGALWPEPPRWRVAGPADATSRVFRFDVRTAAHIASSWWSDRGPTPTLDVCFFDDEGRELRCESWTGQPTIGSRFEGLREGRERTREGSSPERWYVVSEPQSFRVIAPEEAASIELRDPEGGQDQRLIVRAYGYWPELETLVAEPFRQYTSERVRWRYPPIDVRMWFPVRPSNYDALQDRYAIADLHAQVRLEPDLRGGGSRQRLWTRWWMGDPPAADDGWDPGPWVTLEPRGVHRRRSILERLDASASQRLRWRWDASLFTHLRAGVTMLANLSAAGPGAPELHWQVAPRMLGRRVTLWIDDQAHTHTLAATRGRWRLPVHDGRHRLMLELDAPTELWSMWLDRPMWSVSPPVSRRRVVHQLSRELVFPLYKPGTEAVTVNVVVYVPRQRERAELSLSVDGGEPERRTGIVGDRLSVTDRSYTIDAIAAFDDRDRSIDLRLPTRVVDLEARRGPPLDVVTLQVTLGEDIVAGPHQVTVRLHDGGLVWARAFHRGVADRRRTAASWTEIDAEGP